MNKKTSIKAALTAGVLAAGATLALATPASAIVTETDTILIDGDGFDFGGTGWSGGAPTQDAEIQWDQAWFSVIPRVVGTMHFKNVGTECARVRVISWDANGDEMDRDYSDTECAPDNALHSFPVDVLGEVGAVEVNVALESRLTPPPTETWSHVGNSTRTYAAVVDTDSPQINRAYFDLGSGSLSGGNPTGPATLTWEQAGGQLTPRLTGILFIDDTAECARIRMRYTHQQGGGADVTKHGGTVCGVNGQLKRYSVNLAPYTDAAIVSVTISIQKLSGYPATWSTVGSTTADVN